MEPYWQDTERGLTIYHGDCRDVLPTLEGVDLVLTDPPYGMKWDGRILQGPNGTGGGGPTRHYGVTIAGDHAPIDVSTLLDYPRVIIWGLQHYAGLLPVGTVLVWIKRVDSAFGSFLSDADLAYMKGGHGVYCFRDLSLQAKSRRKTHPTQKPVPLFRWCLSKAKPQGLVVDPYSGTGVTGVACKQLGLPCSLIEIEEHYCEIAARRLENTPVLPFPPDPPKVEQADMFT